MTSKLTFKELVHYLDLYSTDPQIRRLIEFIKSGEENVIHGLIEEGMDHENYLFRDNGDWYTPGEYIAHLKNNIDFYEREAREWQDKYEDMKDERDNLRVRSVADLLTEMQSQVRNAEQDRDAAKRKVESIRQQNKELQEKIDVWTILETK